jgi:hypothetical protein
MRLHMDAALVVDRDVEQRVNLAREVNVFSGTPIGTGDRLDEVNGKTHIVRESLGCRLSRLPLFEPKRQRTSSDQ